MATSQGLSPDESAKEHRFGADALRSCGGQIVLLPREHSPGDPCRLIGERDNRSIETSFRCEPFQPLGTAIVKAAATRSAMDRNRSEELRARRPPIARSHDGALVGPIAAESGLPKHAGAGHRLHPSGVDCRVGRAQRGSSARGSQLAGKGRHFAVSAAEIASPFRASRPRSSSESCNSPRLGPGLRNRTDRHTYCLGTRRAPLRNLRAMGRARGKRLGPTRILTRRPPCGFSCRDSGSPRQCQ